MIYLIDDDKAVRRAFELFLKSADMPFISFENASAFLCGFKQEVSDIIVLDLNLPDINGCDLLEKFKEKGINTPVIVVTAFDDPISRDICKEYGVKAFLRKPVDGEALMDLIRYNLPQ